MTDPIRDLLAEEGMSAEVELETFLIGLHDGAVGIAPIPSAAVAALMPARRPRRSVLLGRRRVVTGLIVLGSLGVGVGTAAASPDVRAATQHLVQSVIGSVEAPPTSPATEPHSGPTPGSSGSAAAVDHPGRSDRPSDPAAGNSGRTPNAAVPTPSRGKQIVPAHPEPTPSDPGKSHRP